MMAISFDKENIKKFSIIKQARKKIKQVSQEHESQIM